MLYILYYGSMVILIPGILFSLWAQFRIKSAYKKYSRITARSGWTGREMSEMLLEKYGCNGVAVRRTSGTLTDNYNPSTDILSLSNDIYDGSDIAALGIAAHECGHARQKYEGSPLFSLRGALVTATNIGSIAAVPLEILGIAIEWLSGSTGNIGTVILAIGIFAYSLSTIFALITLPIEIDASRRALKMLTETAVLEKTEIRGAKRVLSAAALTYVASLVVSLLYLLRFLLLITSFRRRD